MCVLYNCICKYYIMEIKLRKTCDNTDLNNSTMGKETAFDSIQLGIIQKTFSLSVVDTFSFFLMVFEKCLFSR